MYLIIKHLHMTVALISIVGFIIRGPLAINQHPIMNKKWLKIAPHVNDTILLAAAIYLAATLHIHPFNSPFILAKVIALIVYIVLGAMVIKRRGSKAMQWTNYLLAILCFGYILGIAFSKDLLFFIG